MSVSLNSLLAASRAGCDARRAAEPIELPDPPDLGPYRVVAPLGRGGFGTVFSAEPAGGGELVALKLLHGIPERQRARFETEVAAHREVESEHLTRLLDAGELTLPDGRRTLYLAYELVRGGTLRDALSQEADVSDAEILAVVGAVARGLADLHVRRLVHRDVKPENVLLGPDGPRLTDLGLIRDAHLPQGRLSGPTRAGDFVGTLGYASPEQIEGRPTDPSSDLWALGVMLFELATGSVPFDRPNPFALAKAIAVDPIPLDDAPSRWRPLLRSLLVRDRGWRHETGAWIALVFTPMAAWIEAGASRDDQPFVPILPKTRRDPPERGSDAERRARRKSRPRIAVDAEGRVPGGIAAALRDYRDPVGREEGLFIARIALAVIAVIIIVAIGARILG